MQSLFLLGCSVVYTVPTAYAQSNLEVDGLGWFRNKSIDARLGFLMGFEKEEVVSLDSAVLEDGAFLLLEQMRRRGYLRPSIKPVFTGASEQIEAEWKVPYEVQLPVDFTAESVTYNIKPGRLFFYKSVEIDGLEGVELKDPERFFMPGGSLISRKKDLAYTQENFERRKNRLVATLESMGYAEVQVVSETSEMDEKTGAVRVRMELDTGPVHRVGEVSVKVLDVESDWLGAIEFSEGEIFNPDWMQGMRAKLRNAAYGAGYPDVVLHSRLGELVPGAEGVLQPVAFELKAGPKVKLSGVRFEGDPDTKRSILKRQSDLESGELLDLRKTDRTRRKLMALGIFRQVELNFQEESEGFREAVYRLTPDTRKKLQTLTGWGSYEQARVGFRWTHQNPFGRAHQYSLSTKQSFKASRVQTKYQIPQFFGTNMNAYTEAEYSTREEIGFDRTRQGGLLGLSKMLGETGVRLALEYGWFIERAEGVDTSDLFVDEDAQVASLSLNASLDRRDSVLFPTSGYNLYATFKTANRALGGSVDFQKFEIGGGYHRSITESTILHFGLRGGVLMGSEGNLPFNERFFPGGENSVRGYQQGEAAPLDRRGDPIGAESYWIGNFEIEERVFRDLSIVAFIDTVGFSQNGGFGGDGDVLSTAGVGIRYHTVVGPLRLEYGHNLNPRPDDPDGTLHFSIGFPF